MGKEAVYNLSLLCRRALRRELCWKPKYRNIYISSSYFWFGLRDLPTQGAHNEGLASHEEPAVKLKGHVNCSDIPTDFCCFRDAILIPRSKEKPLFLHCSPMHYVPTWALSGLFICQIRMSPPFQIYSWEFKLGMISQMVQLPKKAESELDKILSWGKSVHQHKIQAWDGLKFI